MHLSKSADILVDGSVCQRKVSKEELREADRFPVGKWTHFDVSVSACCLLTPPGLLGMPYPPHLHLAALPGSALESNSWLLPLCSHSKTRSLAGEKSCHPTAWVAQSALILNGLHAAQDPVPLSLPTSAATSAAEGPSLSPISWEQACCGHHFNFPPPTSGLSLYTSSLLPLFPCVRKGPFWPCWTPFHRLFP